MIREDLRNIAIIAHVDHGKTTLVNEMLRQGGAFRENQVIADRVMDSGDIERERGITILSKNCACTYNGIKINIIDTPGHADFGGEVERVLKMADGVLLLVDAAEGPMPQTRFVLSKALELGLMLVVVVNKVDRPDARVHEVVDEILELLLELGASEEQFDSPMLFCSGRSGTASYSNEVPGEDLKPLFETIVNYIKPPEGDENGDLQLLVSSVDYNDYVGRIGVGRIERGKIRVGEDVWICDYHDGSVGRRERVSALFQFKDVTRDPCEEAGVGDIVAVSGIGEVNIGNTVCEPDKADPVPFVKISEPTVEMTFSVNDSPFAGTEGEFVTSRQLKERLDRELLKDVSLRVEETDTTDSFKVCGRGEMHLSILIETMRREGYELMVSPPKVLYETIDGVVCEPYERLVCDVPQDSVGSVMEKVGSRRGELTEMIPQGNRTRLEFIIPSRGLFGYRNEFLSDTRGEGIMSAVFEKYAERKGDIAVRQNGSLVAFETGESVTYGLYNAQERGALFIGPGVKVYAGMVVGASPKPGDVTVNVCKKKHVSNMRASGSDEALRLTPPRTLSLEQCIEYLADDELLEVTPKSLRIRKRLLDHAARMREISKKKNQDN